ncbi:aminotransferase class I/II-fold pyridoxal phosphate-dependent enzyme [Burkholderia sp. Ac-20379]|uniref:aminotransferase class I/II-fold pyridoxal phosphate-dependent enzyme n=1 Tax=Burkholderia sp. Ac-20379 TaxID=2703900 RepID=UPI00197DF5DE|nr:aminotransferase class I/II-fold pyridoxal phosphate-dependent enzyme [Burkholderia sp. Ac-20379]MBN3726443.1 aminotransferase class I/II-fold pyridoxal phosphate-dependent enzyme [Burkholderia sp. Ac-20379]
MFADYDEFRRQGMRLDMSRGKPAPEQLDLATRLFAEAGDPGWRARDGADCRNYGLGLGLPEAREFGAALLDADAAQVVAAGNSSLELMHDVLAFAVLHGLPGGSPWRGGEAAMLCPAPGYDRHFAICEALGIRMIAVPMRDDGPDMDVVEALVRSDASIRGIWCVPRYSNPTGAVYSDDTVRRLAALPAAAADFRLMWDDAYRFHHLTDAPRTVPDILPACEAAGHPDRAFVFASLSKVTFGGAGVAFLAGSARNVAWWARHAAVRSIGPDKLNQLRHVHALRDRAGLEALMAGHRALLRPKFETVEAVFAERLGGIAELSWTRPEGGYFVSLDLPPGHAKRAVALAGEAGLVLTPAGAAFPLGDDPLDRHLRIAPSFPSPDAVRAAAHGIAVSVRRALELG